MIDENRLKRYCCEDISLIENYEKAVNDKTQTWNCHHRLEIQNGKHIKTSELIEQNLYYNRPASELILLTKKDHNILHHTGNKNRSGQKASLETRQKMSEAQKEKHSQKRSLQACINISIGHLGQIIPEKTRLAVSKAHKGIPRSEETKLKISLSKIGHKSATKGKKKVWNDESHTKFHYE